MSDYAHSLCAEMTRDEVLEALRGDAAYKFSEIPSGYLDSEVIATWLEHCGELSSIPRQYVDDTHRRIAVGRSHDHQLVRDYPLAAIKKEDTDCYEELALIALKQCDMNMKHVDPALYGEDFFLKALEANRMAMITFLTGLPKAPIEWTEAMIDSAVSKEANYLRFFPKEQIKRECLERLIVEGEHTARELEDAGLLDLMSDLMQGGYWPQMMKPSSLKEALYFMLDIPQSAENLKIYYKAFVRFHPMEEVLPIMKSPDMQALVMEIYRTDELMPHLRTGLLKGAAKVRGKLLENELGL
jgi:hypothetical protein